MNMARILNYWLARRDRLNYVIEEIREGRKQVSDRAYEKLISAVEWCSENIESIDDLEAEEEEIRELTS